MKITQFDKVTARDLAKELEATLQSFAAERGLVAKYKGGSFAAGSFTPKVEFAVISLDGTVMTREAEDFKRYANMFELLPEDLGKSFVANGKVYEITGAAMGSVKYPILGKSCGKTYKFTARLVSANLHPGGLTKVTECNDLLK